VGDVGNGSILITAGTLIASNHAYIGFGPDAVGDVNITGSNSIWDTSTTGNPVFYLGYEGQGLLNIDTAGQVYNNSVWIGYDPNSTGTAQVNGMGTLWQQIGDLHIGHAGSGELNVTNDGMVESPDGFIGYEEGSDGWVTITDANWTVSGILNVGYSGDANMVVSGGGNVWAATGRMAYDGNSVAHAVVTGTNSTWETNGALYIGYNGDANLVVSDGGQIINEDTYIGYHSDAVGRVTVSGPNSVWASSKDLNVGYQGQGYLAIQDGALVTDVDAILGVDIGSDCNVTVTGTGSIWSHLGGLQVGHQGSASLTIEDGATVFNTTGLIGSHADGVGHVTVSGTNALWKNAASLYVGYEGQGTLTIADGGKVTAYNAEIGNNGQGHVQVGENSTLQAGQININANGTLSGGGLIKADTVTSKGVIKPGDSIGTLTVDGDLTLKAGSIIEVEVDNSGNHDRIDVTGDVSIQGGQVQVVSTETINQEQVYTFLSSGSTLPIQGSFDVLDKALLNISSVIKPNANFNYGLDAVSVSIKPVAFDDPSITATATQNEKAVSTALQAIADDGGNTTTSRLQNLPNVKEVHKAYGQLSGQTGTFLAPVSVAGLSKGVEAVSYRMHTVRSGLAYAAGEGPFLAQDFQNDAWSDFFRDDFYNTDTNFDSGIFEDNRPVVDVYNPFDILRDKKWGMWGKAFTVQGDREAEDKALGYEYTVYGTSFGIDWQVSDNWLFGLTGGYTNGDVEQNNSRNESQIAGLHVGLYSAYQMDRWYMDSVFNFADLTYDTSRRIDVTSEHLEGSSGGTQMTGYVEAGYTWRQRGGLLLQPLASLQVAHLSIDAYKESGGPSALTYDDQTYMSAKGSLGLRLTQGLYHRLDGRNGVLEVRSRWLHEFGDTESSVDTAFVDRPDTVFTVVDSDVSRDSILVGGGLDIRFNPRLRLSLDYDSQFNSDDRSDVISFTFQYKN
jgi:outer membrane autotransporter protein